jgi:mannosyltransferase
LLAVKLRLRSLVSRFPRPESLAWPVGIVVLAGILRLFRIGASSLWFDEAFSWLAAQQPAWAALVPQIVPIMPPLYHFLFHFWAALGEDEATLRAFSALWGLLTVPVIYALGRRLFSPAAGLAAALLTAVLPFHVYFSQEARPYALVIFLSALVLWAFVRAWGGAGYREWLAFGVLAALHFYAHYFVAFTLVVLHSFVLLARPFNRRGLRGILLADFVALLLVGPHLPQALARTRQVVTDFWLSSPSLLQPFKTLDYLLFSHTMPFSLNPVALFFTLAIFTLVAWGAIRTREKPRRLLILLIALVLTPLLLALLLSWVVGSVYLDRAFSLVTPAYVLLLGWGLAHPPKGSPVRWLYGGLAILVVISLGNHYLNPDPAKPPFREVGAVVQKGWREGDVMFHLHDSSYLPLRYYVPEAESYLLNNDPETWLPSYTWDWAGRRVLSLDEAIAGRKRLWLVAAEAQMSPELAERHRTIVEWVTTNYACEEAGAWHGVTLVLCDLGEEGGK